MIQGLQMICDISPGAMSRMMARIKFFKLGFVVVSLTPCVCVDLVLQLVQKCVRRATDVRSGAEAVTIWVCVLALQIHFWRWLLFDLPLTCSTCIIQMLLLCWHIVVMKLSTQKQRDELVGHRIFLLLRRLMQEARQEPAAHRGELLRLTMDLVILHHEWDRIAAAGTDYVGIPITPQFFLCWHLFFHGNKILQILRERGGAHMPWQLQPVPLHHDAPEMYCPIHNTCSICLENLCYTPLCPSAETSADRSPPPGSVMLAKLRCNHIFHQECIAAWRARPYKATCPTCQTSMVDDPVASIAVEFHDVKMCITGSVVMLMLLLAPELCPNWWAKWMGAAAAFLCTAFLAARSSGRRQV